jgi:hypothetical protein
MLLLAFPAAGVGAEDPWLTLFERSGGVRTPRYAETIEYCKRLAHASRWVRLTDFGTSPQGRRLPLVILSRDGLFDAARGSKTPKAVILIQSGIHAGEIDGKDASLMLMRDIAVRRTLHHLLDSTVLLFVPIYNVDGHERFGRYNRINQNGPKEMGWRATAQNLNLNRDYMKAEAPETRAMLRLFHAWLPDLFVDCHVTDGIDFQYDITYAVEPPPSLDAGVAEWMQTALLPPALSSVERAGHRMFYYVFPREDRDLAKGLNSEAATPRFSTAYCALQNRPAVLIETHMLKPYKTRVEATYHFLKGLIEAVNAHPSPLRRAVLRADAWLAPETDALGPTRSLPLTFGLGAANSPRVFLGVRQVTEQSAVTGGVRLRYLPDTVTMTVPFYDEVTVEDSVSVPAAYFIPKEWTFVAQKLADHGIVLERLKRDTVLEVESYRFTDVQFRARPYEGRQIPSYKATAFVERRDLPAGTLVVRPRQRAGKVAVHLLEPRGPDSFAAWGYFNAVFEQKEYAEAYVMEEIGARLLAQDPALRRDYEQKVREDTVFAARPSARLNWLYQRSPWGDPGLNVYPVARLLTPARLATEPVRAPRARPYGSRSSR